ncbi:hypothetical protein Cgig2_022659 [Carnegiea gigantea]|uniref:Tetratricopeptide repeat protein n=1 Tax=Carnegiea gigantea TaxID=171969 RepID=A0A9Q1JFQ1_9CARY|nr:hypothetical protein Cgig2_022659 [Carnegiea gigantea]
MTAVCNGPVFSFLINELRDRPDTTGELSSAQLDTGSTGDFVVSIFPMYQKAVQWFEKTLVTIPTSINEMWESTIVNLAHTYRKLKMFREAITYYEKALTLSTRCLSTYAGLAYTYHLQGLYSAAIGNYHKALWLKPDDQFCTEMLTMALAGESRSIITRELTHT